MAEPHRMSDDYYWYPVGGPEHRAAYEEHVIALEGIDAAVPGNPQASYEVDNAWELAYDRRTRKGTRRIGRKRPGGGTRAGSGSRRSFSTTPATSWAGAGGSSRSPTPTARRTSTSSPSRLSRPPASRGERHRRRPACRLGPSPCGNVGSFGFGLCTVSGKNHGPFEMLVRTWGVVPGGVDRAGALPAVVRPLPPVPAGGRRHRPRVLGSSQVGMGRRAPQIALLGHGGSGSTRLLSGWPRILRRCG